MEAKGSKRKQKVAKKEAKRDQNGAKMGPQSDQNTSKNRSSEKGRTIIGNCDFPGYFLESVLGDFRKYTGALKQPGAFKGSFLLIFD